MNAFQILLDSIQPATSEHHFSVDIDASWLQGRTAFGGLSAAVVFEAMRRLVPEDRRLRTLSVCFVGPTPAGRHRIELRPLREGGYVTHLQGDLVCEGGIAVTVTAAFGKARVSKITIPGPAMPIVSPPDAFESLPFIPELIPEFTRHYDMRFTHGAPPLAGAQQADFGMWLRFREQQEPTIAALIAIADVPPMPGLNMIKPPGLGSSLTWYLDFVARLPAMTDETWFYYDYRCEAAGDGYYNNYAAIWTDRGEPLMFSRQVATVFER